MNAAVLPLSAQLSQLSRARARTDALFASVPDALFYERPIPERHRIAFYLGHLEAFDHNLLPEPAGEAQGSELDQLFAFGIDPLGETLPSDRREDWPELEAIRGYADGARARLDRWLPLAAQRQINGVPVPTLLHAAIEHRLMHAETLAYILHQLPLVKTPRPPQAPWREFDDEDMVRIPAGEATLGMAREGAAFGWDNEHAVHRLEVAAFRIDRRMVSNAQYRRFVEAGGYAQPRWWTQIDWRWRAQRSLEHPQGWLPQDGAWYLPTREALRPLPADWPVYVSHAEAAAYARWCGKQLPSEAQWHRAAYGTPQEREHSYPWGEAAPDPSRGNFDFRRWDPLPVDAHPAGASAFGVEGLLGNAWEWTSSEFAPFPGFEAFSFYRGYSADFFDGQHYVLKGGSPHTALPFLRRSFRNWFQAHYPYPFAGFRCVST